MRLPMHTFKGIAVLCLIFVAAKWKTSVTRNRELEVAISQISYEYANCCSFLTLLFIQVGTDYLGKWMTLSYVIWYILSNLLTDAVSQSHVRQFQERKLPWVSL